ncbi:MAG: hypothetical protein M5U28_20150 [Sandaracinaceae bacterium]|nr:hypothetical protein [Sandaracinaceae bacterium]
MSLGRAWRVVRRDLGPILAVSCAVIPIGVLALPCLVGIPISSYGLGKLVVSLLSAARESPGAARAPVRWPGVYALLGFSLLVGAMGLAAWIAVHLASAQSAPVRHAAGFAAALVASIVTGAALAPFAFAPFAVADGVPGLLRPLTRSFELAARLGPARILRLGATAGRWMGVSCLAVAAIFVATVPDRALSSALLAAPFAIIPGPPLAGALLAEAYVEASALPERGATGAGASARLSALAIVLAPTVLLLAGALFAAALTPTPMRAVAMHEPIRRGLHGAYIAAEPQRRELPGGRAAVRSTDRGVVVEAPDGGGAGAIDARFDTTQCALFVEPGETYGGAPGTHAVIVTSDDQWALTIVDGDGVRQDDGLTRRTMGRLGRFGSGALGLGMLLLLVLAYRIGGGPRRGEGARRAGSARGAPRRARGARGHAAPRRGRARPAQAGRARGQLARGGRGVARGRRRSPPLPAARRARACARRDRGAGGRRRAGPPLALRARGARRPASRLDAVARRRAPGDRRARGGRGGARPPRHEGRLVDRAPRRRLARRGRHRPLDVALTRGGRSSRRRPSARQGTGEARRPTWLSCRREDGCGISGGCGRPRRSSRSPWRSAARARCPGRTPRRATLRARAMLRSRPTGRPTPRRATRALGPTPRRATRDRPPRCSHRKARRSTTSSAGRTRRRPA